MKKAYKQPEILIEVLQTSSILTTSDMGVPETGDNDLDFGLLD